MERYAAGDDAVFGELYDLLVPRLYPYLLRRIRNPDRAQDLLQQTLLHLHRARSSFIAGADVWPWVFAIARRLLIDSVRSAHRESELAREAEALGAADATGADDLVEAKELALRLESELAGLPESQRVAFALVRRRGLSLAAAAEALAISVGALKVRIHRAHLALRAALDKTKEES
ncbi:MAG TPA: RNA polymerase sigma factor [Polyangia bacterium]